MLVPRLKVWLLTLATVVLAPLVNGTIAIATGFDISSIALYTFIPAGTFALCALACSGFLYGSIQADYSPDQVDLPLLMIASVASIVLTYLFDYAYMTLRYPEAASQLGSFGRYVLTSITETRYTMYSRAGGVEGPLRAGEGGFLIQVVRIAGAAAVAKIVHSTMVSRAVNVAWERERNERGAA